MPVLKTIDYISQQIFRRKDQTYFQKVFIKLFKLGTACKFTFASGFYKQTDGCTMRWPLCVTFSHIYMNTMENEVSSSNI